jgi:hypothetical protein
MEASPRSNVPTSSGKPRRVEAVIAAKRGRGGGQHINAHDFGMRCWMSRCPYTYGSVMYILVFC